jgi:hypothetical protein
MRISGRIGHCDLGPENWDPASSQKDHAIAFFRIASATAWVQDLAHSFCIALPT